MDAAVAASSTAPTVKLKPVIRKPMIRKPVIGGAKPVTLKPAAGTPPPPAAVPEAAAAAPAPAAAPTDAETAPTAAPAAEPVATETSPATAESPSTVTQKKTLKLKRPGFKRPTVSGLHRPGEVHPAPAASAPADGTGDVSDLSTVTDIPDIKPLPSAALEPAEDDSKTVAGVPAWLNATTLVAGIAALVVIGLCTWTLFREAVGPAAGPNDLASFHSDTDYRR